MVSPIVWKEWHEQRWKMVFGAVMLVFFTAAMAAARVLSAREAAAGVWAFGGLILSLFSAMGVFAPERTEGTIAFLASKPLPAWKVFLCKWLFGWLNVIVPMLVCGLLVLSLEGRRIATWDDLVVKPLVGISMATMFYTMTCCLAPRRAGEAQVALFGLLVLLAYFLHMALWSELLGPRSLSTGLAAMILASLNPVYLLDTLDRGGWMLAPVVVPVQIVMFVLVMWIGLAKWQRSA